MKKLLACVRMEPLNCTTNENPCLANKCHQWLFISLMSNKGAVCQELGVVSSVISALLEYNGGVPCMLFLLFWFVFLLSFVVFQVWSCVLKCLL